MQKKNKYGVIYLIRNKINNKIYIGQTINSFNYRYHGNLMTGTRNEHLKSSIKKYGIENFEIIEEFDVAYSKEELDKLESMYINIYNTTNIRYGYNKKTGGGNGRPSEETRLKMSKAMTGEKNSMFGKTHSDEYKKRLSIMYTGENHFMYGKEVSMERREKQSKTMKMKFEKGEFTPWHKGKKCPQLSGANNGKAKKVICITTGMVFDTAREAGRYYNIKSTSHINSCCTGERKSCGKLEDGTKLVWRHYDEYLKINKECNEVA